MKKNILLFLFAFSFLYPKENRPKLIIYISIDQMRADYFERYLHHYNGGLKKLYTEGIVFKNADLNYASSETGPGHATLGTGAYPKTNGILGNEWVEPTTRKNMYCVADTLAGKVDGEGGGFSSKNLAVTALGDWLKASSLQSKVVTASSKDRAAILMGGQHPNYAFWYQKKNGYMVTSDWYTKQLPEWVKTFNASNWIANNIPNAWTKLLPDSAYTPFGPDEFAAETKWGDNTSFPHVFTEGKKNEQIIGTPYGDMLVLDFAASAIAGEQLGQRGVTDLLCISLSNCDYVGHGYGPDSHEQHDLLLRVDKSLGEFFEKVFATLGKENVVIALSADHAVCPLPEFSKQFRNINARRIVFSKEMQPKIDSLNVQLQHELKTTEHILQKGNFLNYSAAAKTGMDSVKFENRVRAGLLTIDGVTDVYFRRELLETVQTDRPYLQKFKNSYYVPRGEDFQLRFCENCLIAYSETGTTHGTPYSYDTHVPMIFWWNGVTPKKISEEVHIVDIAPTLARKISVSFPATVNGIALPQIK